MCGGASSPPNPFIAQFYPSSPPVSGQGYSLGMVAEVGPERSSFAGVVDFARAEDVADADVEEATFR
jgi:hypothetical protein